jgi:hypothetical protein
MGRAFSWRRERAVDVSAIVISDAGVTTILERWQYSRAFPSRRRRASRRGPADGEAGEGSQIALSQNLWRCTGGRIQAQMHALRRLLLHAQIRFRDPPRAGAHGRKSEMPSCRPATASTVTASASTGAWAIRATDEQTCRAAPFERHRIHHEGCRRLGRSHGMAPVAPHFGDFAISTRAAFANTIAALLAGSTSIGNLGQYFAFRQPHWDDDAFTIADSLRPLHLPPRSQSRSWFIRKSTTASPRFSSILLFGRCPPDRAHSKEMPHMREK